MVPQPPQDTPRARQSPSRASPDRSRSVQRPASMIMSRSVSATRRHNGSGKFMPAPTAPLRPAPECDQGQRCLGDCLLQVTFSVVDVDDVDPVEPEPSETGLDAAQDAVAGVVTDPTQIVDDIETAVGEVGTRGGVVAREAFRSSWTRRRRRAVSTSTRSPAVVPTAQGRSEEPCRSSAPLFPGAVDRRGGLLVADPAVQVADRRPAETQRGQPETNPSCGSVPERSGVAVHGRDPLRAPLEVAGSCMIRVSPWVSVIPASSHVEFFLARGRAKPIFDRMYLHRQERPSLP